MVRENIVRHLERGEDHFAAARNGTSEIGLAVFATSMSIVAVFVPVAFMKGIVGRFFFQFGMTVAFAVLVSLFVSFTLDPMLSSRWFDPAIAARGSRRGLARLLEKFNSGFDRVADTYRGAVGWALDHRKMVLTLALAAFVGGLAAFGSLQSAFFPDIDSGEFNVTFKTAPDASIAESRGRLEALLAEIRVNPEVDHTYATIGAGDNGTVRSGVIFVKLKDRSERTATRRRSSRSSAGGSWECRGSSSPSRRSAESGGQQKATPGQPARHGHLPCSRPTRPSCGTRCTRSQGSSIIEISLEHDIPEYRLTVDRDKGADRRGDDR